MLLILISGGTVLNRWREHIVEIPLCRCLTYNEFENLLFRAILGSSDISSNIIHIPRSFFIPFFYSIRLFYVVFLLSFLNLAV